MCVKREFGRLLLLIACPERPESDEDLLPLNLHLATPADLGVLSSEAACRIVCST